MYVPFFWIHLMIKNVTHVYSLRFYTMDVLTYITIYK